MKSSRDCRMEQVPTRLIKRMPGLQIGASQKRIEKIKDFAKKRGYCTPVILSESQGCMTLLTGVSTFEACLEAKETSVPAVIVQTEGGADDVLFALQSAELDEAPHAIAVSAAIVYLIDQYGISRKHIATSLGRSASWINRMESLSRRLHDTVQQLVAEGQILPRTAQEIARLPKDVQLTFAMSVSSDFLSKENVIYLVNRYLDEGVDNEERDRIIRSPALALPNEIKSRRRKSWYLSDSTRLSRAMARCLDDAAYLSRLLDRIDVNETAFNMSDIIALTDSLDVLRRKMKRMFLPG